MAEKSISEKLLDMKEKIQKAKTEKAELGGQIKEKKAQLEKEFGCKTIPQAEKKMKKLQEEIAKMEQELEKGVEKLEADHDWE